MAYRIPNSQKLHDKVIHFASSNLDKKNYDIYVNPNIEKNAGVGLHYPDIVLTEKGKNTVKFIIEVETAESVNIIEATNQWKKFSTEIKCSFYILVPLSSKNLAISLCKQVGISARFGTYKTDVYGNVTEIKYE